LDIVIALLAERRTVPHMGRTLALCAIIFAGYKESNLFPDLNPAPEKLDTFARAVVRTCLPKDLLNPMSF
jgi:hypothetical protein